MPLDLDHLESVARAAPEGLTVTGYGVNRAEREYLVAIQPATALQLIERIRKLEAWVERNRWHSAHETPDFCGATATRVVVRLERIDNPPAMNAPPHYGFGHRIVVENNPNWPANGWFFDGQDRDYHVTAWRYIDGDTALESTP